MAYYAIKRELQPITLGLKRTVETAPADRYTRAHIEKIHRIETWACNLTLETQETEVCVSTYNLLTGQRKEWHDMGKHVQLLPNRSTEISEFTIPVFRENANRLANAAEGREGKEENEEQQTVVAVVLSIGHIQVARAVNWPEPLKYVHFPKPEIKLRLASTTNDSERANGREPTSGHPQEADMVVLSADVPVKGVVIEVKDYEKLGSPVTFADNGIDLVPGESVSIGVEGLHLGDEHHLTVRYLGM